MFDEMMKHFGSNVTAVNGFWTGPLSDNLNEVNRLTAAGMSLEAAAMRTWTSKRAANWGYSRIQVLSTVGAPGNHTKVVVLFKK